MRPASFGTVTALAACLMLSGCGGSGSSNPVQCGCSVPVGPSAGLVYATQINTENLFGTRNPTASDQILTFGAGGTGSVTPTATLTGPTGYTFQNIGTDSAGNLYVLAINESTYTSEILVYNAGATGTATPARTINGVNTGLSSPLALTVDGSGNIYVLDNHTGGTPGVLVFAAGANGNVAPARTIHDITPPSGGFANSIAVDGSGNIFVPEYIGGGRVVVFSATANGTSTPTRTLSGGEFNRSSGILTVNGAGDVYLATEDVSGNYAEIAVYPASDNGSVTPTRVIGGGTALGFQSSFNSVKLDSSGYVYAMLAVEPVFPTVNISLVTFSPSTSGNVAPTSTMTSTQLTTGTSIALH